MLVWPPASDEVSDCPAFWHHGPCREAIWGTLMHIKIPTGSRYSVELETAVSIGDATDTETVELSCCDGAGVIVGRARELGGILDVDMVS